MSEMCPIVRMKVQRQDRKAELAPCSAMRPRRVTIGRRLAFSHARPEADPNQPGWDAPQERPALEQLERPGQRYRCGAPQHPADDVILDKQLQPLRGARREAPTTLNGLKLLC
jgi:hypothetical protein